jgi:hypothetical protein
MKQLLIAGIAALMTATFAAEPAAARVGFAARQRIVIHPRIVIYPRPRYPALDHGTIYGYAPGYYQRGRNGVLYGPYPLNPDAPIAQLRY